MPRNFKVRRKGGLNRYTQRWTMINKCTHCGFEFKLEIESEHILKITECYCPLCSKKGLILVIR